jgi:hypothetical protein
VVGPLKRKSCVAFLAFAYCGLYSYVLHDSIVHCYHVLPHLLASQQFLFFIFYYVVVQGIWPESFSGHLYIYTTSVTVAEEYLK